MVQELCSETLGCAICTKLHPAIARAKEDKMVKNVGHPVDIALRIIIGVALLSLLVFLHGDLRWLGLIGLVPILTALFGWCPGWAALGINTARKH
jgi:Inner membrane protein YgaP-like, transmembrane domain